MTTKGRQAMTTITEQVRAAAEEIERGIYKAFCPNTPDDDVDLADWVKTTTRLDVAEIITKHVLPASLTDAIEVVKGLRDEWDKSDDPAYITVIKMRAATEIITTLESLQGKAPVGESDELIALKRLLFCTRWFVKDCKDTQTMAAWEHAKQVIEKRAATTPSSGEEE